MTRSSIPNAGFTPGPWGVEDPMGPDTLTIVGNPGEEVYNWLWVATVALDDESDGGGAYIQREEAEANARLIAASPMLFDACGDALEAFKLLAAGLSHNRAVIDMIKPHIDELQFALAKARGDQ